MPSDLQGWKAIAAYLGVTAGTVSRWTRELGLPVYRLAGGVRAEKAELDKWTRDRRTKVGRV